jgi:tripartite-type tricarboxylate transporter receptor subunit TctC
LLFSIALLVHGGAQTPSFKDKSVRVIVGFPPGGGSDAEGRVIAHHLGKYR